MSKFLINFNVDHRGQDIVLPDVVDGTGYDDTIHLSGARDVDIIANRVIGGKEDVIDFNNECENCSFYCGNIVANGYYGITVKGGSQGIILSGEFEKPAQRVEVDWGNWSDQSKKPTKYNTVNLRRKDGKPVRMRLINGEKPQQVAGSGPYRYVFPWPIPVFHPIAVWMFMFVRGKLGWFKKA